MIRLELRKNFSNLIYECSQFQEVHGVFINHLT